MPISNLDQLQRFRQHNDGIITNTYTVQERCEEECSFFFFALEDIPLNEQLALQNAGFANENLEPRLMREKHVEYLKRGLNFLSSGFECLDASRPWICYWILHALDLLNALPTDYLNRVISSLIACWHPDGGFGGGPMQLGHTATTYASCLSLALMGTPEGWNSVDRNGLYKFFLRRKHPTAGAFSAHEGGEVDVRVTYCVIAIASLYGILTDELIAGVVSYVASCQTYEGGFGGEPNNEAHGGYAFCAVSTLWILNSIDKITDLPLFLHWLSNRQMAFEGGFQGRTNKLVDGCYSFWQGALPALLQATPLVGNSIYQGNQEELQRYILLCCQQIDGGLRDKPGKPRDHYHTCYCLSGLSIAQHGFASVRTSPVVVGDTENLLMPIHPAYNISRDKVNAIQLHFSKKGLFKPNKLV